MSETTIATGVEDGERGSPQRLVVNPYVTVVTYTDDEILYRHGSRSGYSRVLRDDGRRRVLGPVLAGVAGAARSRDEVLDLAGSSVETRQAASEVLDRLIADGVVVPEDGALATMYFHMRTGQPPRSLAHATVGLLGLGSMGGQIGQQLAALGVGAVVGIDDRPVAAADQPFLRGTLGVAGKVGAPLAEAFRSSARARGLGNVSVRPASLQDEAAVADLVDESDLLIVAMESFPPSLLHRVNEVAVAAEKPWLPVHADGSEVIVGPLVVPGTSPCYNEYEIQHEASRVLRTEYLLYKEELSKGGLVGTPPLLPPYAGIGASWAVTGALSYLIDGTSFLVGRVVRVDFERLDVINERVLRLPRCPACGMLRPDFRHPFL